MEEKKVEEKNKVSVEEYCTDELYATWYICRECGCENILTTFIFCPKCGMEIDW